jgi:hypothetical protein
MAAIRPDLAEGIRVLDAIRLVLVSPPPAGDSNVFQKYSLSPLTTVIWYQPSGAVFPDTVAG